MYFPGQKVKVTVENSKLHAEWDYVAIVEAVELKPTRLILRTIDTDYPVEVNPKKQKVEIL